MTIVAYRIVKTKFAGSAFDGEGSRLFPGRWNSAGVGMVYAAESPALAVLEILVHLDDGDLIPKFTLYEVRFDDRLVETIDPATLPPGWDALSAPPGLAAIGDEWAASARTPVLKVPSVVLNVAGQPAAVNYLLNPAHPRFAELDIDPGREFQFDRRLVRRAD